MAVLAGVLAARPGKASWRRCVRQASLELEYLSWSSPGWAGPARAPRPAQLASWTRSSWRKKPSGLPDRKGQHFITVVYTVRTVRQGAGTEPSSALSQTSEERRTRQAANIKHALAAARHGAVQPVL